MNAPPIVFTWDGESMIPLRHFAARCDREFVIGQPYRMEVREERSWASHGHFFAALHDAWQSLPEHLAPQFPSAEHLRKRALIHTGWRDERSIPLSSKAEAQRVAAFVRPSDEYAVVVVHEATVTILTAKSQSVKAMGRKDFQRSKDDALGYVADLIGVDPAELSRNAGKAAA